MNNENINNIFDSLVFTILKNTKNTSLTAGSPVRSPVHRFDRQFIRFDPGSIKKRFLALNRTGFMANRRSDRPVRSGFQNIVKNTKKH